MDSKKTVPVKEPSKGSKDGFAAVNPNDQWRPRPGDDDAYVPRFKPLWRNFITIAGLYVITMATILIVTFFLFALVTPTTNPYVDIVGYLVLPTILVAGLLLVPFGILFKSWLLKRRDPTQRLEFHLPRIDLRDPAQRRTAKSIIGGTFLLIPVVGVSSYHGYHYTDSAEFCSKACHAVMQPQATTYEHSAHARVACAECHIGEGASWFVKSKLSGTRQVLAVMAESYSRPIPTAIHHLRPARETCEHCHWPQKFFGAQLREIVHFTSDEPNTPHHIDMLIKTGGGDETTGRAQGIHLHMALEGKIEYVATDEKLQVIPWVRYTDRSGNVWIYRSDERPSSDPVPTGTIRKFDCMDCHNRPAHEFRTPQEALDIYLDVQKIDTTLPFIKREAVQALVVPYPDGDAAHLRIGERIAEFYRTKYPEVWNKRQAAVHQAIDRIREIYSRNIFPYMRVDWTTYPDNIGHLYSPGCFRCHDGEHVDQRGQRISSECSLCHTFLNPVEKEGGDAMIRKGEFIHPIELKGMHAQLNCSQCHSGGVSPSRSCDGCHADVTAFRQGTFAAFADLKLPAEPMADTVDCESCHDVSRPLTLASVDGYCLSCHEDEEEKYKGLLASWDKEIRELLEQADGHAVGEQRATLETLRRVGPLHHPEATKTIIQRLRESPAPNARPATVQ